MTARERDILAKISQGFPNKRIARALEISSETLYVRAGILDEPDDSLDLVREIRRDPLLSEEQKKTIVRIYESFRRENEAAGSAALG